MFFMQINILLCSLCNNFNETPVHLFHDCELTNSLWNDLKSFFHPLIDLSNLTPQSALFGFVVKDEDFILKNHILLLFKYCVYKYRTDNLTFHTILSKIKSTFLVEKNIYMHNTNVFDKKWKKVSCLLH